MEERRTNHRGEATYEHVQAAGDHSPTAAASAQPPSKLINLASTSVPVTNADDEVAPSPSA